MTTEDLRAHFAPFAATTDYPACLFWKELLVAFPDAKLVHSTRSPESWATSVLETIFTMQVRCYRAHWGLSLSPSDILPACALSLQPDNLACPIGTRLLHTLFPFKVGRPFAAMVGSVIAAHTKSDYSHAGLQKTFKEWEAFILAAAPKGRVLVFEAKQGWEPLCKFLGVPVPAEPFPRVNDTAEMKRITFAINTLGWVVAAMYVAGAAWLAGKLAPVLLG